MQFGTIAPNTHTHEGRVNYAESNLGLSPLEPGEHTTLGR